MDTREVSILNIGGNKIDITYLKNRKLLQYKDRKIFIKELPLYPCPDCAICNEFADVVVQVIGNNKQFMHVYSCGDCIDVIVDFARSSRQIYADQQSRVGN